MNNNFEDLSIAQLEILKEIFLNCKEDPTLIDTYINELSKLIYEFYDDGTNNEELEV